MSPVRVLARDASPLVTGLDVPHVLPRAVMARRRRERDTRRDAGEQDEQKQEWCVAQRIPSSPPAQRKGERAA